MKMAQNFRQQAFGSNPRRPLQPGVTPRTVQPLPRPAPDVGFGNGPGRPNMPLAQPMPRPQIDTGFGNGPGRPNMPLAQPIVQAPSPIPSGPGSSGPGAPMPVTDSIQQMGGGMAGGFGGGMDGVGGMKRGGKVKKMASGGMTSKVSSASKRGDGIAQRGKTKGKMC